MAQNETAVAQGAAALYAANIITLGLNTLYLVLLTNFVSLQEVGLVSLLNLIVIGAATLAVLALPISGAGVSATPPAVARFISQFMGGKGPARRVYVFSALICLLVSVAAAIGMSLPETARLLAPSRDLDAVALAGLDVVMYSFAQLGGYSMLGAGKATAMGKLMIASSVLRYAAASVLLVLLGPAGVFLGFAIGDALMAGVANLSSYRGVAAETFSGVSMKPVFAYMASVFLAAIMGFAITQTDKFLAFFSQGLGNLALYNIAAVGAAVASFAPNAATNVLVPALSAQGLSQEKKRETLKIYTRHVTLAAAPMGFGLAAVSPFLLRVFGDTYAQAAPLMAVISVCIALTAVASVYSSILLVEDQAHQFTVSSLLALVALVVVALETVPSIGLLGIALGRSVMLFVMMGAVALFVRRRNMLVLDKQAYAKSIAASSIMALVIFALLELAGATLPLGRGGSVLLSVLMMPAGFVIYLVAMKLMNAFNLADVEFVESLLPSWLRWLGAVARKLL